MLVRERRGAGQTDAETLEDAMRRFSLGDDKAYARVYASAWEPVVRAIQCAVKSRALAEDVAQETFIKIYGARETYRLGAKVLPWARTIARRTLIDTMRRQAMERSYVSSIASSSRELESRADEQLDAKRAAEKTLEAIGRLPKRQAKALELVTSEGATVVEIAERLGETPLAIRLRVHRARAFLRSEVLCERARDRHSARAA